mmetsp:Transcript_48462/g.65980  ORF Transcript_48462/g.65980 Transcript_48462/m.65980 type:complete len:81 (-) Transcript_48462:122-364(-)
MVRNNIFRQEFSSSDLHLSFSHLGCEERRMHVFIARRTTLHGIHAMYIAGGCGEWTGEAYPMRADCCPIPPTSEHGGMES